MTHCSSSAILGVLKGLIFCLQEAKISTVDNKDGTVDVSYLPTALGDYDINVLFNQQPVPGAPFKAKVTPKGGAYDLSGVKIKDLDQGKNFCSAFGVLMDIETSLHKHDFLQFCLFLVVPVQSRQQIKIVTTDQKHPRLEVQEVVAEIISATTGKKIPVRLTPTPDGKAVLADFIPTEIGENVLNVKVGGQPIPNQPQKFTVSPNPDISKVKVEGPGLSHGEVGVPAKFRIDSRKAGIAPIGLGINGPAVSLDKSVSETIKATIS